MLHLRVGIIEHILVQRFGDFSGSSPSNFTQNNHQSLGPKFPYDSNLCGIRPLSTLKSLKNCWWSTSDSCCLACTFCHICTMATSSTLSHCPVPSEEEHGRVLENWAFEDNSNGAMVKTAVRPRNAVGGN